MVGVLNDVARRAGVIVVTREFSLNILCHVQFVSVYTKLLQKGAHWMLDAVLTSLVGGWATDSYKNLINPVLTVDYIKAIVFFVGFGVSIVYTTILVLRHWNMLKGQKETTVDVFSKNNLPPLQEIFSNVNNGIHLVGVSLESLNHITDSIEKTVRNGKKVRILVCHPQHNFMNEIENMVVSKDTGKRIEGTFGMLNQVKNNVGNNKSKLEIKTYKNTIPTQSMIIVDPNTDSSYMQIEPYPFQTHQQNRKIFKVSEREQGELFDVYWSSYEKMWDAN